MEEKKQDQLTALYEVIFTESLNGYSLQPKLGKSNNFKYRKAVIDEKLCEPCWDKYGTVYPAKGAPTTLQIRLKSHPFCRCSIEWMLSILAGTATVNGYDGADYVVKHTGELPDNYMHKTEAKQKGGNKGKVTYGMYFQVYVCTSPIATWKISCRKIPIANGMKRILIITEGIETAREFCFLMMD